MEILRTQEIDWMIELNNIPGYSEEVVHLRGKYIPVIDFRNRYRLFLSPYTTEAAISVFKTKGKFLAFFISDIHEVNC